MPDITLYADDAERIIQALWNARADIRHRATMQALSALADKMIDRVAQGLHPVKPVEPAESGECDRCGGRHYSFQCGQVTRD